MAGGSDLLVPFALFAGTIFAGVASHRAFERTGVPDAILLLGLGALAGPVLHVVDPATVAAAAPYIGGFALLVILLEGGLELNYHHVVEKARATTLLTLLNLGVTTALVAGAVHLAGFGLWPAGILLGVIVAPLSASVLVPMLGGLPIKPETRALLSMECTLGEALAVVGVVVLTQAALLGGVQPEPLVAQLALTFGVGVAIAIVGGLAWIELLRVLRGAPYRYMLTLAAAVGLFTAIQAAGGNGYVGVLVFGLVLGNAREISAHLPAALRTTVELSDAVRWMNTEVTFFVRTFFFVYLGLILGVAAFTPDKLLLAAALLGVMLAARAGAVQVLVRMRPEEREDAQALVVLVPRGLATAVLAAVPLSSGLPGAPLLVELATVLIVLTNLAMTAGLVALRRSKPAAAPGSAEAAGPAAAGVPAGPPEPLPAGPDR